MSKRKFGDECLSCSVVRGIGIELLWTVDNVNSVLAERRPVASEWLEVGGPGRLMIVELLLRPCATRKPDHGQETMAFLFSALDGHEGRNLPGAVRFQVINQLRLELCATLEEGRGVVRVGRSSWATEELIPVSALLDPTLGFVVADRLTIRVEAQYCN